MATLNITKEQPKTTQRQILKMRAPYYLDNSPMLKATILSSLVLLSIAPAVHPNPAADLTAAEESIHFCWQTRWELRNFQGVRDAAHNQKVQAMQRRCTQAWHHTQQSMAQGEIPFGGNPLPQAYPFDPPLSWFTSPPRKPQPQGQQ